MTSGDRWAKLDAHIAGHLSGKTVTARRAAWETAVDDVILPALQNAVAAMPTLEAKLWVERLNVFENFSTVQLWFGKRPTGISYRRERLSEEGKPVIEAAIGLEQGAALLFSQGEQGKVVALAYRFSTKLPAGDSGDGEPTPSREEPWLGPSWEPMEVTSAAVEDVLEDFLQFVVTTSIFWDGESVTPTRFRRPAALQMAKAHIDVEELLHIARRSAAFNEQIVGAGIAQILSDLERLTEEVDERELEEFLEKISPNPRLRRVLGKWLEDRTAGFIGEKDLRPR